MGKKPIIAIANSFDEFLPGHVHLQQGRPHSISEAIKEAGGIPREFNTMAVDDGIAMGHTGMLYSLPSRDIIADTVEYQVQRALRRRPDLHPELRQGRPGHAHGRAAPQHPHRIRLRRPDGGRHHRSSPDGTVKKSTDLIDVMYATADDSVSDEEPCSTTRRPSARPAAPAPACSPPTR